MKITFPTDSYRGDLPVNFYPAADAERGVVAFGTPGLTEKVDLTGGYEVRGMAVFGDYLFAVVADGTYPATTTSSLWRIDSTWSATDVGTINTSTGPVWFADNGTQLLITDGSATGYVYISATQNMQSITDPDFPGAGACAFADGYGVFIKPDSGQLWVTASYDFLNIDALDFATAEGAPDNAVSLQVDHRELWIFNDATTEVWQNTGGDFPYTRLPGGFIERGCASPGCTAKIDNTVYWLARKNQVLRAEGYVPKIISTRKIERIWDSYETNADARAFAYTWGGHSFYHLTFPTAGKTWVYDVSTGIWHERRSYPDEGRHRANCWVYWDRKHYVGDFENGKIYELDADVYADNTNEIIRYLTFAEINEDNKRLFFPGVQIEFDAGQGLISGQGSAPQAMLQWSDDGGYTWSSGVWADVGDMGEYSKRAIWRRLGSSYHRLFRLRVSDPVKWTVLGINKT